MQKHEKKREKGVPFLAFFRFFSFLFLFFFADKRKSLIFATKSRNLLCPSTNAKTDNMKLSVIVPVYNVELFLSRCLDSILRQGMEVGEYEVICVNDGSPDNSAQILANYQAKHPDIFRVVTQENQGLGDARNTGTALARGEYVAYVDSDDYLIDGAYRYLLDTFCKDKPDVLHFSYQNIYTDGTQVPDSDANLEGRVVFDGDGAEAFNNQILTNNVWSKLYKRTFLKEHGIHSEIVICQDALFNFEVCRHHPRTVIVTSSLYRYENGNVDSIQKTGKKEVVMVQLNELLYNMGIVERYLQGGEEDMRPAALRLRNSFMRLYYKKMLVVPLTKNEWKRHTDILGRKNRRKVKNDTSQWRMNLEANVKNMAGHSYWEYRLVRFLYQHLFREILFPLLITR